MTEDELEAGPVDKIPPGQEPVINPPSVPPVKNLDKINNLTQKERALSRVGVTREKAYAEIFAALEATHWIDECDEQGNIKRVKRPNAARRQWGAEMAIKMFGDMIERKEIEHDIGDRTLDRFRALSVDQLKAQAAAILAGKPITRLPAIDV